MKNLKYLSLWSFFIVLFILINSVNSYVLSDDKKAISYSVEISNYDEYDDYLFIMAFQNIGSATPEKDIIQSYKIFNSSRLDNLWNFRTYIIYAIKKSDFNESNILRYSQIKEYSSNWTLPVYDNLNDYFTNEKFFKSNSSIKYPWLLDKKDLRTQVTDIITIKVIANGNILFEKTEEPLSTVLKTGTFYSYLPLIIVLVTIISVLLILKFNKENNKHNKK